MRDLRCGAIGGYVILAWNLRCFRSWSSRFQEAGQVLRGELIERFERFAKHGGTLAKFDNNVYSYSSKYGLDLFTTANLGLSMIIDVDTMFDLHSDVDYNLFDATAVRIMEVICATFDNEDLVYS